MWVRSQLRENSIKIVCVCALPLSIQVDLFFLQSKLQLTHQVKQQYNIFTSLYNPNLFPHWKYILNYLLFKSSARVIFSILTNSKQYSNIVGLSSCCLLPTSKSPWFDLLLYRVTPSFLNNKTVLWENYKIWFVTLTQSRQLWRKL